MAKHFIIGMGNLGTDLWKELSNKGEDVSCWIPDKCITDRQRRSNVSDLAKYNPDYIWYCVGGGSVDEAEKNPEKMRIINIEIPKEMLAKGDGKTKLILFSSDYVFGPDTEYAEIKREMEQTFKDNPRVKMFRVTSLYGFHQPEKSLYYKLLKNYFFNKENLVVAVNEVCPTPTHWLVNHLIIDIEIDAPGISNMWPRSDGRDVCGVLRNLVGDPQLEIPIFIDKKRPKFLPGGDLPNIEKNYFYRQDMLRMWRIFVERELMPFYNNPSNLKQATNSYDPSKDHQEHKKFVPSLWLLPENMKDTTSGTIV